MRGDLMTSVYLDAPQVMSVRQDPIPGITRPNEALVRIGAVGVCGSDVHFFERGRIGPFVVDEPLILGHECAGTVMEVGEEARGIAPGDRVAIEPGIPCRKCRKCREGRYNLCEQVVFFMATPGLSQGAFREYITWPADLLFKLPSSATLEDGAMVEPLAVGVHACRRGGISPGQSVAVLGAGPIGQLAAQTAAAYGGHPVIVTDIITRRLKLAGKLGFTTFSAEENDPVTAIRELTNGGADVVIETAGTAATIRQAMGAVRTGGVVVLVGMPPEDEATLPVIDILMREYDIRSVFRYANCYLPALSLIAAEKIQLSPLRSHTFPLAQAEKAIRTALEQKTLAMKVMVTV